MLTKCPRQGVEFVTECSGCNKAKRTSACGPCQRPVLFCTLCRIPVKGAANACLACGHGGHLMHMKQWFQVSFMQFQPLSMVYSMLFLFYRLKNHNVCASGCGCQCLQQTALILEFIK